MFAEKYVCLFFENQFIMATFKTCVSSQWNDGLFAVLISVTHNRVAQYIKTNKTVHKSKLRRGEIKDVDILSYCSNLIKLYSERLNAVDCTAWDVHEVVDYLLNIDEDISFSKYAGQYVRDMAVNRGMERNSKNYKWAYQSLEKFAETNDIKFSMLITKFIHDWMKTLEKTSRAKEMYPVCIRMIYKADIPEKRALGIETIIR